MKTNNGSLLQNLQKDHLLLLRLCQYTFLQYVILSLSPDFPVSSSPNYLNESMLISTRQDTFVDTCFVNGSLFWTNWEMMSKDWNMIGAKKEALKKSYFKGQVIQTKYWEKVYVKFESTDRYTTHMLNFWVVSSRLGYLGTPRYPWITSQHTVYLKGIICKESPVGVEIIHIFSPSLLPYSKYPHAHVGMDNAWFQGTARSHPPDRHTPSSRSGLPTTYAVSQAS